MKRPARSKPSLRGRKSARLRPATVKGRPGVPAGTEGAPRQDLSDRARAQLEEMIVSLELPPGSVWSEADLSARLGIGRTPVREALQLLESEHLVTIVRRHGVQVTEINVMQQLLLLELRRALEKVLATSAARRATAEERTRLVAMADELERIGTVDKDVLKFLRRHHEIKKFVALCARNPFVARAIAPCYAMSRRFYYLHHRQDPDLAIAVRHHANVIRAIARGDEVEASAACDKLMEYVVAFTRATITNGLA